jgi:lysyl-tRNA synthetase class 2
MNDTLVVSQQYPWWNKDRISRLLPKLRERNQTMALIRRWFEDRQFIEVETPTLQISPGLEPHLLAFKTSLREPFDECDHPLYLQTSPEYAMKKLLVGGLEQIFQFAKCFRNGERSKIHHPEFTMLEWYRVNENWRRVAGDAESLIRLAATSLGVKEFRLGDRICYPQKPFEYLSVVEAFKSFAQIDLRPTLTDPLQPDRVLFAHMARDIGVRVLDEDSWDVIFDRILLEKIEPNLGIGSGVVLHDYPLPLAALARQSISDPCLSERFEVYLCGVELANGFGELIDFSEQSERFKADLSKRHSLGKELYPVDQDFLAALESGMPDASGAAMGFDRLMMLLSSAASLEEVVLSPVLNGTY